MQPQQIQFLQHLNKILNTLNDDQCSETSMTNE